MTIRLSTATRNALLSATAFKEQFATFFIYIFNGTEPASADAALDMAATHTQLVKVSKGGDGVTALEWGVAADGVLPKPGADNWQGPRTFDGANAATSPLAPTFFRLCAAGDDGRGAADATTGYRVQGSVGGPGTGRDMVLSTANLTDDDGMQTIGDASATI